MDEKSLQALKIAAKSVQTFASAFAKVSTTMNQAMKKSVEAITKTWQKTATAINQSWQKAMNAINQSLKKASNTIVQAWQKAANGISQAWQKTANQISQSWQRTSNGINKSWQKTGSSMNQIWQRANSGINRGWKQAGNNINRAWQQANNGIHKGWNRATSGYNRIQQQKTRQGSSNGASPTESSTEDAREDNKPTKESKKADRIKKGAAVHAAVRENIGKWFGGLGSKMLGFGQNMGVDAIKGATESEDIRSRYNAKYGNRQEGTQVYEALRAQALLSGKDVSKSLESGLTLTSVSKNTQDLTRMNEMVQRLSAFQANGDPTETAKLMQEAYFGKSEGLIEQLKIPVSETEQEKLQSFSKSGDLNGFLQTFDALMAKANMSKASLEMLMDSPARKWEETVNRFNGLLGAAGENAVQMFTPMLDLLNQAFQTGQFDNFFAVLSGGLAIIAQLASWVVEGFLWLVDVFNNNLPLILPILGAIIGALMMYYTIMTIIVVVTQISAAMQTLWNAIMALNPVTIVILALVALIGAFLALIAVMEPVREGFANALRSMGQMVAGFVAGAIQAFTWLVNKAFDMINFLLEGVNRVANAIGSILGIKEKLDIKLEHIKTDEFQSDISATIEGGFNAAADGVENFSVDNFKKKFGIDNLTKLTKSNNSYKPEKLPELPKAPETMPGTTGGVMPGLNPGATMNIPKVGEVGKVGAIDNKVEITDESIEMMRDLAEMDAIQNFVSLTPTVQVNTGDIHQGFDMDTLINRIEKKLEEEFVSTAEGVYG
ncbi:hypothetical protein RQP50_03190 [Paenibacillus sp. chi10]|uniref:Phage tail tape measure protein n=1 Tax=Paenibacillus suaedae TaxID=3077233 RepID=A0AAJ2JSY5_9BACL|nr:hypothetical protein [Paenibacillus sp. chi10]MDT8975246.1 hypothetical protein [Paenibacillus sp. chi10]